MAFFNRFSAMDAIDLKSRSKPKCSKERTVTNSMRHRNGILLDNQILLKGWILGECGLLLAGGAFFLIRKRSPAAGTGPSSAQAVLFDAPDAAAAVSTPRRDSNAPTPPQPQSTLLNTLKEELFAIEIEKASGNLSLSEYERIKAGLEAVLKRALEGRTR
jgi:hypothetical protein